MPSERVATLIIGGGQAGLAMSHMLKQRGCPHVVVERHRVAERWRSERWDGLRFQFPNWAVKLPDFAFSYADPDAFATPEEIVAFITAYAERIAPPLRTGVEVTALRRRSDQKAFVAATSAGVIEATNVVVATGPYQRPKIPDLLRDWPGLFQVHASRYRNPAQLAEGAVLVIGSGASGVQITEELMRAGRKVFLAVGHHRRLPRRYRGKDFWFWATATGRDQTPVEQRGPDRTLPLITGAYGGHTIDLRQYAVDGVTLLGRLTDARDGLLYFAADLADNLKAGDESYEMFLDAVDAHVAQHGLTAPEEPTARVKLPDPPGIATSPRQLDIRGSNIRALIWATGYDFDFNWIDIPAFAANSGPRHHHGVSEVPGLYFIGLQWLSKVTSSFLSGVGDDAARLAGHIAARRAL
jgi:putative flavoprotein involved in K+ transport